MGEWRGGEWRGERRKRENMRDKSLYRPRGKYEKFLYLCNCWKPLPGSLRGKSLSPALSVGRASPQPSPWERELS